MLSRSTALSAAVGVVVASGLAVVPIAGTAAADGSTIHVDKSSSACSDTAADAGSAAQPYCTLQTAVDTAQPGDTVQVTHGDYPPLDIKNSGTASAPITIEGQASRPVWLNAPRTAVGTALRFDHVSDVVVKHVEPSTESNDPTVDIVGSHQVVFDQGYIWGNSSTTPTVSVDGQSSGVTLSRTLLSSQASGGAVAIASGATGTVLTTNMVESSIIADSAPGTVVVGNTFALKRCPAVIALSGASTGATVENNVVHQGTAASPCGADASAPISVSAGSTTGIHEDYNTIENTSAGPLYDWAGQSYASAAALDSATGQAAHDNSLMVTGSTTPAEERAQYVDSADQNAPDELSTDAKGQARVDDPLIADTGTGSGYYDRGALEYQDPYTIKEHLSARIGPAPFTENITTSESNPWNTKVIGYTFDFGDGTAPLTSATPSASHAYTAQGQYTVQVTAALADGATRTDYETVTADAPAPLVPRFSVAHSWGKSSLTVTANGQATDGWSISSYTFDFGDGTAPVTVPWYQVATHTYAKPGTYTVSATVKDDGGNTAHATQQVHVGSALMPLGPTRVLDTRYGIGARKAQLGPGGVLRLKVTGTAGVPADGVTAVTLNLTGLDATSSTWIGAYPDGAARPTASTLNLEPGRITPNLVTVPVGADGYVDLYNHSGSVDLVADVQGYYSDTVPVGGNTPQAGFVQPYGPQRVMDTRYGIGTYKGKVGPGSTASFQLPPDVPLGASAVVLNVTETGATASSYVAVQQGSSTPSTSILNFTAGQTTSNQVVVPIGLDGTVTFYNHSGTVDLIADLQGLVRSAGSPYFPITPARLLDTRSTKSPISGGSKVKVQVAGVDGIPAGVKAVLVNLTGIKPSTATWLSAYGDGSALPGSSNLNLAAGDVRAVLALVPVGADGSIDIYNHAGSVDAAADVEGYYIGG